MKIVMKHYELDNFQDKDVYTWEEIIATIKELEIQNKILEYKIEDLTEIIKNNIGGKDGRTSNN